MKIIGDIRYERVVKKIKEDFEAALKEIKNRLNPGAARTKNLVAITNKNFQTFTEANDEFLKIMSEKLGKTHLRLSDKELEELNYLRNQLSGYPLLLFNEFKTNTITRLDEFLSDYETPAGTSFNYQNEVENIEDFDFEEASRTEEK